MSVEGWWSESRYVKRGKNHIKLVFNAAPKINISPVPDIVFCTGLLHMIYYWNLKTYWSLWPVKNEFCRSHMKSCPTVTDNRLLFHALQRHMSRFRIIHQFYILRCHLDMDGSSNGANLKTVEKWHAKIQSCNLLFFHFHTDTFFWYVVVAAFPLLIKDITLSNSFSLIISLSLLCAD